MEGIAPNWRHPAVGLGLGEPKHAPPGFVVDCLADAGRLRTDLAAYPVTRGAALLREAICAWLGRRFGIAAEAERHVLPVAGTREALFSIAQAVVGKKKKPVVVLPNPFYQIYEGAALMSGAEPCYVPAEAANGHVPDYACVPEAVWRRTELLYLCSPGNPTGKVLPGEMQRWLIEQAHRFDFIIAADECYSEIYLDEAAPPTGLLRESDAMGNPGFRRCLVFHSLSKRSNLPGLRSGFVAGDAEVLDRYYLYRTYQGCAMPAQVQQASALAWGDEGHVRANRGLYRAKFDAATPLLQSAFAVTAPEGGFYFWLPTGQDDCTFAQALYRDLNLRVLPGTFLGREVAGCNPGAGHIRIALVAPQAECVAALKRLVDWLHARQ